MPCFLPTVRVSVPLHRRLAIDADVGPALFWGNREIGQIPDGRAVDAQIRWMRKDRKSNGMGRYWLFGASYAQGRRITRGVVTREYAYRNLQFGYGWDQLSTAFAPDSSSRSVQSGTARDTRVSLSCGAGASRRPRGSCMREWKGPRREATLEAGLWRNRDRLLSFDVSDVAAALLLTSPSSRGLGRGPFKAKTRVRIPLGTLDFRWV